MPVSGEAAVRAAVQAAWRQVAQGAELDEALTWQEAGVDSLKSLQLLLFIENTLGCSISFDLFTRETRIGDLIARLSGNAGPPGSVRAPRSAPRRGYLVPGALGDDPVLAELRASLRDDIAFATLQLPDLASPIELSADLDATAAFLADQVPEDSTGGRVILAGYSFGAHAALATALALQARGVVVDLLCLFDPLTGRLPGPSVAPKFWPRLARKLFGLDPVTLLVRGLLAFGWVRPARRLALMFASMQDFNGAYMRRRHVLFQLRHMAVSGWRPKAFHGRTVLFATEDFERVGDPGRYLDLLPGATIARLPGGHERMFEGEALRTIVETLRALVADQPAYGSASMASSARRSGL